MIRLPDVPEERAFRHRLAVAVGLVLLVAAAWGAGVHGVFTYDDKVETVGNATIRFLQAWREVVAYNPARALTVLTWAVNYHFAGMDPTWWHLVDIGLQAVAAILLALLVESLARAWRHPRPARLALLAAAAWAVHPLASEAVIYVAGRSEQLCAVFYLASLLAWLGYLRSGRLRLAALAWAALALGLVSKEVAATLPAAWVLFSLLALPRTARAARHPLLATLPGWLLLGLALAVRARLPGGLLPEPLARPLAVQFWTEAEVLVRYLALTLLPVGQSIFHDHPETGPALRSAGALLLLSVLTAGALLQVRRRPWLALGWLCFLILPAPSTVVPLRETMAEHRAYLAMAGVLVPLAVGLDALGRGGRLVGAAWVGLLLVGANLRGRVWSDEVALWSEATRRNPASAEAWYGLGDAHRFAGELERAAEAYRAAIERDPELVDARVNLGIVQARMGDDEGATATWLAALRRHPRACRPHTNLGLLAARRGQVNQARQELETAVLLCPDDPLPRYFLARLFDERLHDPRRALYHYQVVLQLDPDFRLSSEVRQRVLELTW